MDTKNTSCYVPNLYENYLANLKLLLTILSHSCFRMALLYMLRRKQKTSLSMFKGENKNKHHCNKTSIVTLYVFILSRGTKKFSAALYG